MMHQLYGIRELNAMNNIRTVILNEIMSFCEECSSRECCPEEECVLYRIEQIVESIDWGDLE